MQAVTTTAPPADPLLTRLGALCQGRGLTGLATRLGELADLAGGDLSACEADLEAVSASLPADRRASLVAASGKHLLDLGGKRLRPLCVALASRVGEGFSAEARALAVAVELVHGATLLHDDVVDLGDTRRGAPAARMLYGNAASIFAGDWLLVDALRRVRRARVPGTLDRLLDVIEEMIFAESVQLERRGHVDPDRNAWFRIVEGKTAALFRWAMWAGGKAGRLDDDGCAALERFGLHLGVAFQAVDDMLDVAGDPVATGKSLGVDLREGKMTYPLVVALEVDPRLAPVVEAIARGDAETDGLLTALERTGALDATRKLARDRAAEALTCLANLPRGRARDALATVAEAAVERDR
jgi:octaprenyl-diphosphate synthase